MKIVHCADLHIDAAHSAFGTGAARRAAEVLYTLRSITEFCREQGAEALLIAGDLFDNPCPSPSAVEAVKDAFRMIPNTHVFIAAGNHDYLTPSSPYFGQWSENVYIFRDENCFEFDSFRVYGRSFFAPFEEAFEPIKATPDGKINLLLLHGDIFGGQYNPLTEQTIAETEMDYVALGHVHAPSGIKQAGRTAYAYPGSAEPLGFDEPGERGALYGTVRKSGVEMELVRLCKRVCREFTIDASPFASEGELLGHIDNILSPFSGDMIKIILTGECSFSPSLPRLLTALEGKAFSLKIKNKTYPKENLELLKNEQTLKGFFVQKMLQKIENSSDREKEKAEAALRLGLAAFAGREVGLYED